MLHTGRMVSAALTLALSAAAQTVPAGTQGPSFEFEGSLNGAPASFQGFRGRAVLIEFFATW